MDAAPRPSLLPPAAVGESVKIETALMSMQNNSPQSAEIRRLDYLREVEPWVRIRSGMAPVGGFSYIQKADGTLGHRTDNWSPEQLETTALIDAEIANIGERYGLSRETA